LGQNRPKRFNFAVFSRQAGKIDLGGVVLLAVIDDTEIKIFTTFFFLPTVHLVDLHHRGNAPDSFGRMSICFFFFLCVCFVLVAEASPK
jgi:hypothetical protein